MQQIVQITVVSPARICVIHHAQGVVIILVVANVYQDVRERVRGHVITSAKDVAVLAQVVTVAKVAQEFVMAVVRVVVHHLAVVVQVVVRADANLVVVVVAVVQLVAVVDKERRLICQII